ncbi:MAG: hypothetical protein JST16_12850 [Bdellovibrionales bacterium]|nr:hypothetical protein [Bdellovibrionales bacterium]
MKALVLIKNQQERMTLKLCFSDFADSDFLKSVEECSSALRRANDYDLLVLDEHAGNIKGVIEEMVVLRPRKPPLVMVILSERQQNDEAYFLESERVASYTDLGVEMFLYRPFGKADFAEKMSTAKSWISAPPPWLQLVRVSRDMIRHQQSEKILVGLEKLHAAMPDDVNIGLLIARSYAACQPPQLDRAIEVLAKLKSRHPSSQPVLAALVDLQLQANRLESALVEAFALLAHKAIPEHLDRVIGIFDALGAQAPRDIAFWSRHLNSMAALSSKSMDAVKNYLFSKIVDSANQAEHVEICLDQLRNAPARSAKETLALLNRLRGLLVSAQGSDRWNQPTMKRLRVRFHEQVLELDPGSGQDLEAFVDLQLGAGLTQAAESRLRKVRMAGNVGFEYCVGMARLSLETNLLDKARHFVDSARAMPNVDGRHKIVSMLQQRISDAANAVKLNTGS